MNDPRHQAGVPSEARSEGRAAMSEAKEGARELTREAADRARTAAREAKETARDAVERGKERTRGLLDEQKEAAASRLSTMADALRDSARKLDEDDEHRSASLAESAAGQLERFADTLRERDLDGFLVEAGDFARRRPALFLGGAVAAGFVLSRFLKSSGERDHHASGGFDEAFDDELEEDGAAWGREHGATGFAPPTSVGGSSSTPPTRHAYGVPPPSHPGTKTPFEEDER